MPSSSSYPNGIDIVAPSLTWNGSAIGGLQYFAESQNTTAPNNSTSIHAFTPLNPATADVSVAIVPVGFGAFCLSIPDGTAVGGNPRGLVAVDLQIVRDFPEQVASGSAAFLAGISNQAPGGYSGGWGISNSFVGQGSGGWGTNNDILGENAGGWGYQNQIIGNFSGGWGSNNTADAPFCNVFGLHAHSHGREHTTIISTGLETSPGDSQLVFGVQRNRTSDATPTPLTSDSLTTVSAANTITFNADGVYGITFNLTAKNPGTSQCGMWLIQVWVLVNGGTVTTPGISIQSIGTPTLAVTINSSVVAINTTFDSVYLNVTGIAATNIKWVATYSMNENRD